MLTRQGGIIWYSLANPSHKQTPLVQLSVLTSKEDVIVCVHHKQDVYVISDWAGVSFLSERVVPHKLFTPLLTGMVVTGVFLTLILVVLFYKYVQVR